MDSFHVMIFLFTDINYVDLRNIRDTNYSFVAKFENKYSDNKIKYI